MRGELSHLSDFIASVTIMSYCFRAEKLGKKSLTTAN